MSDVVAGAIAKAASPTMPRARKSVVKLDANAVSALPMVMRPASTTSRCARDRRSMKSPSGTDTNSIGSPSAAPCSNATWLSVKASAPRIVSWSGPITDFEYTAAPSARLNTTSCKARPLTARDDDVISKGLRY